MRLILVATVLAVAASCTPAAAPRDGGDDDTGEAETTDTGGAVEDTTTVDDTGATTADTGDVPDTDSGDQTTDDTTGAEDTSGTEDTGEDTGPPPCEADADCDDTNPCTTDVCGLGGVCKFIGNGADCDDGDPCTYDDECDGPKCIGVPLVCEDDELCTDDSCDELGECLFAPNDLACDDGSACTDGDKCQNTVCVAGALTVCDDENVCTADTCNPETGECSFVSLNDGASCDDGDLCSVGDSCHADVCEPGFQLNCDDADVCTDDFCDPTTGFCVTTPNEQPCDDESVCTAVDQCQDGKCVGLDPIDCSDGNQCTDDPCDPVLGECGHINNTKFCEDGNPCTAGDKCKNSVCKSGDQPFCDDENDCTTDFCDPETGECAYEPVLVGGCEDGDQCTLFDSCAEGECLAGAPKVCDDGNSCTLNQCNSETGDCQHPGVEDGLACDDGLPCTLEDLCTESECAGTPKDCDDGDPCTEGEACDAPSGQCTPGSAVNCDDGNECTADDCSSEDGGCQNIAEADGLECELPSSCDIASCIDGECSSEGGQDCDDGNPCTIDTCNAATGGCQYSAEDCGSSTVDCLNGFCDQAAGGCVVDGDDAKCNDNISCSIDACEPGLGCTHSYAGCGCQQALVQNFDTGAAPGWVLSGTHPFVKWQVVSDLKSTTGLGSLYFGNPTTQNYNAKSAGTATANSVVVPSTAAPVLRFWVYYAIELGSTWDKFFVRVNGNEVWSKANGSGSVWQLVTVNLAAYKGQTVSVQFDFDTIDSLYNSTFGIVVDDVEIVGCD